MKNMLRLIFVILILSFPFELVGQAKITIIGKVSDNLGNLLKGANIKIKDASNGSSTNIYGDYIFELPEEYNGLDVVLEVQGLLVFN